MIRRRLVATSSFALAAGLGVISLTDPSVSVAASEETPSSGLSGQRVLVEQLQVAARVRRAEEEQTRAQLEAAAAAAAAEAAAEAERARAAQAARRARPARPVAHVSGPVDWRALVAQYPWDVAVAERIVGCESHGDPNARNRSGATGLFQILGGPIDPAANVAAAYDMYRSRGWQPWSASRSCWG